MKVHIVYVEYPLGTIIEIIGAYDSEEKADKRISELSLKSGKFGYDLDSIELELE